MSLTIRYLSNPAKLLDLSCEEMTFFEEASVNLRERTGIYVDPYGDTKIYPNHQKIIFDYLGLRCGDECDRITAFLRGAYENNEILLAIGD